VRMARMSEVEVVLFSAASSRIERGSVTRRSWGGGGISRIIERIGVFFVVVDDVVVVVIVVVNRPAK